MPIAAGQPSAHSVLVEAKGQVKKRPIGRMCNRHASRSNRDTVGGSRLLQYFHGARRYLEENADLRQAYGKLRAVEMSEEIAFNNSDFEHLANQYLDVFDEAITAIESNPGDVSSVVEELQAVGKRHKRINGVEESSFAKLQEGFVQMARHVLQDRFTEKCEDSFRKLFGFVEKCLAQGFNAS